MKTTDHLFWVEKYRPTKISDCILAKGLRERFESVLETESLPHFLFHGDPGSGKTTVAKALCNELNLTMKFINGSKDSGIGTLRDDIVTFASLKGISGGRKCVIIDEADYLNQQSTQPALRGVLEAYSKQTSFILTCNDPTRVIEAVQSRCALIDFTIPESERSSVYKQFVKRLHQILKNEKVSTTKADLLAVSKHFFPDFRKTIGEIQSYVQGNDSKLDQGILGEAISFDDAFDLMKKNDFAKMRKWAADNSRKDPKTVYNYLYTKCYGKLVPETIPLAVKAIQIHMDMHTRSLIPEITILSALVAIYEQCEFK